MYRQGSRVGEAPGGRRVRILTLRASAVRAMRGPMEAVGGIVRRARRPPGWVAPGPRPSRAHDVAPRPGEDLCYLAGEWRILQRVDGHRWSLDDLVTAWVAFDECAPSPPDRLVDLGCGIGTVLLLL